MVTCCIDSNENQQSLYYQLNQQLKDEDGAHYHLVSRNKIMETQQVAQIKVMILRCHSSIVMNKEFITCEKVKNAFIVINIPIGMLLSLRT